MKTDSMDEQAGKDRRSFHSKINHFFEGLGTDLPPMPVRPFAGPLTARRRPA